MRLTVDFFVQMPDDLAVPTLSSEPPIVQNGVTYPNLGLLFADLDEPAALQQLTADLEQRHFEFWWEASRAASDPDQPELIRLYPIDSDNKPDSFVTIPRQLLHQILADWQTFLADNREHTKTYHA